MSPANHAFIHTVKLTSGDQYGIQDEYGIRDAVADVIKNNPMFTGLLKNIVHDVFTSRAIPTANAIPGSAQNDMQNIIGALVTNPTLGETITGYNTHFSGISPLAGKV